MIPTGAKVYVATRPVDFSRKVRTGWWRWCATVAPIRSYVSGAIVWRGRPGASRGLPSLESSAT